MASKLLQIHPVLAAPEVAATVAFYQKLGFTLQFQDPPEQPNYAVLTRDRVELHAQWADATQWAHGVDRPVYRFLVADVDALFGEFLACGGLTTNASHGPWAKPGNTPWGTREFHLHDPGKNGLQFYQPLADDQT